MTFSGASREFKRGPGLRPSDHTISSTSRRGGRIMAYKAFRTVRRPPTWTGRIDILRTLFVAACIIYLFMIFNSDSSPKEMHGGQSTTNVTGFTFWSSDFHIGPVADIKDILEPLGVNILDKSLSGHCHLHQTCAKDLKVITRKNGIDLGPCPYQLRRDFFNSYKDDPEMNMVDAFLCNHACGMCELFMPFDRPMVVIASTRYEIGRHSEERWTEWNRNLQRIAANPRNVIAANNIYDAEYIRYFTGIQSVQVIPSYCGYITDEYNPSRVEILVGPSRGVNERLLSELKAQALEHHMTFSTIRELYPHFKYSDLVQHRAIVLFPYQVSIMSIFEYYRMDIPIFVPAPRLLTEWHITYRILRERTWDGTKYGRFANASKILRHPDTTDIAFDPNDEVHGDAIEYWIRKSDFYMWPHVQTFDSFDELINKLKTDDLDKISRAMKVENADMKTRVQTQWLSILHKAFHGVSPRSHSPRIPSSSSDGLDDFDIAMNTLYNVQIPVNTCYSPR